MSDPAQDPLGPRVRALFGDLAHAGELSGQDVVSGEAGRADAGTRVRFWLQLSGGRIREVRYRAYGCPFTLAACEWLARELTGRAFTGRPAMGNPPDWATELGIPAARLGRLLVIEDALRSCCDAASRDARSAGSVDESVTDSG